MNGNETHEDDKHSTGTDQQSERRVHLHTHIDKPGAILEVRPEGQGFASERDMSYLNREEARDVYEQLGSFLGEQCGNGRAVDTDTEQGCESA